MPVQPSRCTNSYRQQSLPATSAKEQPEQGNDNDDPKQRVDNNAQDRRYEDDDDSDDYVEQHELTGTHERRSPNGKYKCAPAHQRNIVAGASIWRSHVRKHGAEGQAKLALQKSRAPVPPFGRLRRLGTEVRTREQMGERALVEAARVAFGLQSAGSSDQNLQAGPQRGRAGHIAQSGDRDRGPT
jgi:hypothetical protein